MEEESEPSSIRVAIESSQFTEYVRFEGNHKRREREKRGFMDGIYNAPDYDYPYLYALDVPDEAGMTLEDRKRQARTVLATLGNEQSVQEANGPRRGLYGPFFDKQLKKIMLVEVASRMRHYSADSEVQKLAIKEDFMQLNRDLYGAMDERLFSALMHEEKHRATTFVPTSKRATMIKRSLVSYFLMHEPKEEQLDTNGALLGGLREITRRRYKRVFAAVPDTGCEVMYDAHECQTIVQEALKAGGLAEKGWKAFVDPSKVSPATNAWDKTIALPCDTLRTAAQLRRLIVHEQEVHARRAQNGEEAGLSILRSGTAEYGAAEEGLGVLLECAVDGTLENESFHRVRDRYITAGLALGLDGSAKDGRATFSLLWRMIAVRLAENGSITDDTIKTAKTLAMKATENAFRGTNFLMPGIIYMKLKVYYEGLRDNIVYFSRGNGESLEEKLDAALRGKYNHTNPKEFAAVQSIIA